MFLPYIALMLASALLVGSQRPSFAGNRPIGYPELYDRTTTPINELGNRFGEGTTQRLPIEAKGDQELVDRLSKLPIDQQPFWLINWQALEEHRKNPQTYPQRPNPFIDSNSAVNAGNTNNGIPNSSAGVLNFNGGTQTLAPSVNLAVPASNNAAQGSNFAIQIPNTGNTNLNNGLPNFDFISQGGIVQSSTSNTKDPNRAIIITPQTSNSAGPISGTQNFNNGIPSFDFIGTNGAKVNRSPVIPNSNKESLNNLSPNNGVPLNKKNTNTQTVISSTNTKNKDTGIRTSSNFESQNTNSFFVNGNPPPNSGIPARIPGFNSRISETAPHNSNGNGVQGTNTESPKNQYTTYSYGYENHYNYKYNYSYEIPYTYTTNVKRH